MICWVSIEAQQQVVYGTIQSDGYNKITKGAFWVSRPEAKIVYNGGYPDGVEVILLEEEYFVRFAKGENNPLDINYIVFPKGERVYKKNGEYFAAICGNKIIFLQPTNLVQIKEVEKKIYLDSPIIRNDWNPMEISNFPQAKKKKSKLVEYLCVFLGGSLIATAGYLLSQKGNPGGAPLTPREPYVPSTPPPPPPNNGGGPGGSPLTP